MPKFDTSLDSGALTTLAGLGALAYFTRDKKDGKDKPKDKAAEALVKAAEKPNGGSSYTGPIGDATNDPVKAAPEPQTKAPPISNKIATNKNVAGGLKPYPLKTLQNEDKPSKPFPTELAAKNKAAAAAKTAKAAKKAKADAENKEFRNRSLPPALKEGGSVRSTASKRGDGIAKRGFTRA